MAVFQTTGKEGPTIHYCYETSVQYPDIGGDQQLSYRGLLRILQEAAARDSDRCGYGIKDIPVRGVFWILAGWRVQLLERPGWCAPITVETWPRSMDGFSSERDFIVRSGSTTVARATSRWLLINTRTGHIARVTPELKAAFPLDSASLFDTPIPTHGTPLHQGEDNFSTTVGRRDIDTNHHVNNLHYLDYALEALPQAVCDHLPPTLEIIYRRQIMAGTEIHCYYGTSAAGGHQVDIRSLDAAGKPVHHAFIHLY